MTRLAVLLAAIVLVWLIDRARRSPDLADRLPIPEHFDDRDWLVEAAVG